MSVKFKQLFATPGQAEHDAEVIVVPGLTEARPESWLCNSQQPWLKSMMSHHPGKVQVWSYEWAPAHALKGSLLDHLSTEGTSCAGALCAHCEGNAVRRLPLLIVCHGLGGVVFKKALCLLKNEYLYGSVFRRIHGIVFLSTPHLTNPDQWDEELVHLLCRPTMKGSNSATSPGLKSKDDRDLFVQICDGCDFPVFPGQVVSGYSVMASRATPRKLLSKFFKPKPTIRVIKRYAVTSAPLEKSIGVACSFKSACHIERPSELYTAIAEAIDSLVLQGPQLIKQKFQLPELDGFEDATIKSHTSRMATSVSIALGTVPHINPSNSLAPEASAAIGVSTTEPHNKSPVLPYFPQKLPPQHPRFFGREDIFDLIDTALLDEGGPAGVPNAGGQLRTFALCGVGGVGKTETAINYVVSRRDRFDAIFWVTADDRNILYEEYARICTDLQIIDPQSAQDLMAVCGTTRWWLSNPAKSIDKPLAGANEARWLLVFDNVDNFAVLEDLWPSTGIGSILLTSRNALAKAQVFTATNGCDLEPFTDADSVRFLNSLTLHPPDEADEAATVALVQLTGGLPLLINQMAGAMQNSNVTRARMLDMLNDAGIQALYDGRIGNATEEDRARRVFTLSAKLGLEPLEPDTLSLLQIISFLDPDKVPQAIFEDHMSVAGLPGLATDKAGFESSTRQLIQSSLVLQNQQEGSKNLRLHRIVQDVVREAMSVSRRAEALTAAVRLVAESWVFIDLLARWEIERYPKCAVIFRSVVRVLSHYRQMFETGQVAASEIAARLFNDSGWYWLERGFPEESVVFYQTAQKIAERLLLVPGPNEAAEYQLREAHTNISTAAAETNKAGLCLEHSLKYLDMSLTRNTDTGDLVVDFELGLTYNEAGVAQAMNGQYRDSLESFRKCAEIWRSLDDYDETMMGLPFGNIGLVHWIEGRYTEALETLHEMRTIYARNYGVDDVRTFKTGKVLFALGNVYLSVGDVSHAFEYHGRALNQWLATLGKGHHRIGDVTHKLCMDYMAIKDYRNAQSYLDQALKIFASRTYHRNELARSTYKQGQLYTAVRRHDAAEQAFRSAYRLRSVIVPEDKRTVQELKEQDYDDLVIYWSR